MPIKSEQRFAKRQPCPVCAGHSGSPKGVGLRCFGFLSDGGEWAHCTREEFSGGLPLHEASSTYVHRLLGECRCGQVHDLQPATYEPSGNPPRTVTATYDYCDKTGSLLFQVVRYEPKEFKQRRPNGEGGWIWNLEGVDPVLYQLPELKTADPAEPVFIVEGEKDVDRLIAMGLVATTNAMGARNWRDEYAGCLKGRSVVVVPDNDKDGSDHAAAVALSLQGQAKSLKVLELPGLPEKGDSTDWLDQGHEVEELIELASAAAEWEPASFRISEPTRLGESEERRFTLIPSTDVMLPDDDIEGGSLGPYIPYPSSLVMLVGESSAGKTVLGKDMAYHLAEGLDWVGISPSGEQRVIYIDLESPENVFREHAEIIGRSENLVFARSLPTLDSPKGAEEFLSVCRQFSPDVIFLDSLAEAWPVQDENDNAEASNQMLAIKMIAKSLGCTVVVTWNMGEGNVKERFKARGATARVDRSDIVLNYTGLTDNTRQLKIVKSRYGTLNKVLTLRFSGELGFEVVDANITSTPSAIADLARMVKDKLQFGVMTRKELVASLGNDDLLDKVLGRLVKAGEVCRPKRGSSELEVSSESPNPGEKDSEETSDGSPTDDD